MPTFFVSCRISYAVGERHGRYFQTTSVSLICCWRMGRTQTRPDNWPRRLDDTSHRSHWRWTSATSTWSMSACVLCRVYLNYVCVHLNAHVCLYESYVLFVIFDHYSNERTRQTLARGNKIKIGWIVSEPPNCAARALLLQNK